MYKNVYYSKLESFKEHFKYENFTTNYDFNVELHCTIL